MTMTGRPDARPSDLDLSTVADRLDGIAAHVQRVEADAARDRARVDLLAREVVSLRSELNEARAYAAEARMALVDVVAAVRAMHAVTGGLPPIAFPETLSASPTVPTSVDG